MKGSTIAIAIIVVILLGGGWYLLSSSPGAAPSAAQPAGALGTNGSPDQTNTGDQAIAPVVTVAHDDALGDYLVATNGMTLYRYAKDATAVSNCSGTCIVNWPPYIHSVQEPLIGGMGATGMLATIARDDGVQQVIYNGVPLYYWKSDKKPGDTTGQNVGGVWSVVKP